MLLSANTLATGSNSNHANAGEVSERSGTKSVGCLSVNFGCLVNIVGGSRWAVGIQWARQDGSGAGVGGIASSCGGMWRGYLRCNCVL